MKKMETDVQRWLKKDGEKFLNSIGIKEGQTILDFGCGEGHYTIPAAKLVGKSGRVYAVDEDRQVLDELMEIAVKLSLGNIRPIEIKKVLGIIGIRNGSVDIALLYDIIHLVDDRSKLYEEIYRILKLGGLLSVYPKHYRLDDPGWGLQNLSLGDIKREIERKSFCFERKLFKRLMHDDYYDKGYILNFRKIKTK